MVARPYPVKLADDESVDYLEAGYGPKSGGAIGLTEGIGAVYTRRWMVELVLDVAGYTVEAPILDRVLCEPSCGHGSFLAVIAERIAKAAIASNRTSYNDLAPRVIAYDIEEDSVTESVIRVTEALSDAGIDPDLSQRVAESWVRQGDFLLSFIPPVDYVVGNPPYVRSVELPRELRKTYADAIWSVTMGSDLFVGFIQHGLDALTQHGDLTSFALIAGSKTDTANDSASMS